jgi:hypothetical protein
MVRNMNRVDMWLLLEEIPDGSYKEVYRTEDYYDTFKVYCQMLNSTSGYIPCYCLALLEKFSQYHSFNEESLIWVDNEVGGVTEV